MSKPFVAVDFDGVLNTYDGWKGEEELFLPREGALQFLYELAQDYEVIIFSTRSPAKIETWLVEHDMIDFVSTVTKSKPPAHAYIDDRAVPFQGSYSEILAKVKSFVPYWAGKNKDEEISRETIGDKK